ncbi:MAG TPA: UDP-N-acetylmuramoyl-L-alanine--D-glutamate ligase [Acidobacteriota bacterium]|nr:UDP-N-acetylmuramoyl-L-alanine--D-glutamate ligase [Acidobacteriota bacterium]
MELTGKNILVVGLARSGLAAAQFLLRRQARVSATDLRPAAELQDALSRLQGAVRLRLGGHDREDFLRADLVILSPGVPASLPEVRAAVEAGVPVWSEVELAFRYSRGTFVGITGSNGKTTTTELLGRICREAGLKTVVGGNVGTPLVQFADDSDAETVFVVELSSFQLETISSFRCRIALLLNVTPDHMDRYPDFATYLEAKKRVFLNQTSDDFAVLNRDDPTTASLERSLRAQKFYFSRRSRTAPGAGVRDGIVTIQWRDEALAVMPAAESPLMGLHNLENVLAATSAAYLLGIPADRIRDGVRSFPGVEHRLEFVRQIQGVDFYNDSKATNPESTARALEAFDRPLFVIMGGLDKGGDFSILSDLLKARARKALLIGAAADKIARALPPQLDQRRCDSLEEAVREAFEEARPGDLVLLSPACASFDMFDDYEHRGRVFKEAAKALEQAPEEKCR